MRKNLGRALVEVAFILFLFYANLLMGEFTHSGAAHGRGLLWAMRDVISRENLLMGVIAALIGYSLAEFLRRRL
jgi:hypothetical protein